MKKWVCLALFGMILFLAACGGNTGTEENGGTSTEVSSGQEVYKANCAMCHGADLSGGGGPPLAQIGSKYSAEELADIVQNGIGSMPAQKHVSGQELENLTNWLASKQ